jgi:transcriptional regulator with XRE-family HTH domain
MSSPWLHANLVPFPVMPVRLGFAVMSSEEMAQRRVRRGYWLRRARLKSGLSMQWVAEQLGQKSASSVSLWERALRDPKTEQMVAMAHLYGLPDEFLVDPPLTDDERLDEAMNAAAALEREDAARAEAARRAAEPSPVRELRRRSA